MTYHVPVMVSEVLGYLPVAKAGVVVDCTVGGGGHAEAILTAYSPRRLIGLDVDPEALTRARSRLAGFEDRLTLVRGSFRRLRSILNELDQTEVDAVLFDLGVSLHQLITPPRGLLQPDDAH